MNQSGILLTKLATFFESNQSKVFTEAALSEIMSENRVEWNLPQGTTTQGFIRILLAKSKMKQLTLEARSHSSALRYSWGSNASPLSVGLSLRRDSYLSHASAMWIHGIGKIERKIFVNREQTQKNPSQGSLTQEGIDRAFRSEQRQSSLIYDFEKQEIVILSGKHTGRFEVYEFRGPNGEVVDATSLERTLIDITVRPAYAGGVLGVVEGYIAARDKISVAKLLTILKKLDFKYPYHQAIGFYLKRAEYGKHDQELLKQFEINFKFHLCHGLSNPAFDADWNIFVPRALI